MGKEGKEFTMRIALMPRIREEEGMQMGRTFTFFIRVIRAIRG